MKRIMIVLLFSNIVYAEPAYQLSSHPLVAIYANPIANAQAQSQGAISTPIVTTVTQQAVQYTTLQQLIEPNVSLLYRSLQEYIKKHWLLCTLVTASALYAALFAYIVYTHHALHELHCWSIWHSHETFEQLSAHPHNILKKALVKDIAAHYINPTNPTDALWPLNHFMHAIKEEEFRLKRYLSIVSLIQRTPFFRVLPTLQDEFAKDSLNRLNFVYHLFSAWSADLTWERLMQTGDRICLEKK